MDTPTRSASAGDSRPLSGWKEIAEHLGKSVRAVQRWEHDYRLPVHRIKTPTGHIVYAFRSEIDAWRAAMGPEAMRLEAAAGLADLAPEQTPTDDTIEPKSGSRRGSAASWRTIAIVTTAVFAIVLATGSLFLRRATAFPAHPARVIVEGQSLVAQTEDGQTVWSYALGWKPEDLKHSDPTTNLQTIQADIDGDGSEETFVVLHSPPQHGEPWAETIYCFSSTGKLRWSYTPHLRLSFGGQAYDGPWRIYGMVASMQSGRQRVWAAYGHHTWWPSFVVELDAQGIAVPKYFQSGAIYTLEPWSTEGHEYLLAGGVDNAYSRASVAVIDTNGPAVTSPQDAGPAEFRCDSCPTDRPVFFALLPRTEINQVGSVAYNWVSTIRAIGPECFIDTHEQGSQPASAAYILRNNFSFGDAGLDDHYWQLHRQYEREGRIHHPADACPDLHRTQAIRTWKLDVGWADAPCEFDKAVPGR